MTITQCLLCLELNADLNNGFQINSALGKEQYVENVIEKHLWPMATLKSNSLWLCLTCWIYLKDFHHFYERIEAAQLSHEHLIKKEVDIAIEDSTLTQEILILPDRILNENVWYDSGTNKTFESKEHILETTETYKEDTVKGKYHQSASPEQDQDRNPLELSSNKDSQLFVHIHKDNDISNTSKSIQSEDCNLQDYEQISTDEHTVFFKVSKDTLKKGIESFQHEKTPVEYDDFIAQHFKITCSLCEHSSKTFGKLRQHFASEHKHMYPFVVCCGRKIKRPRCLYEHIHSHLNPDYFKCKYCARVLKDRRNLLDHMLRHEGKIEKNTKGRQSTNRKTKENVSAYQFRKSLGTPELKNKNDLNMECNKSLQEDVHSDNIPFENDTYESHPLGKNGTSQLLETYHPDDSDNEDQDEFLVKHIEIRCPLCYAKCENFLKLRHHFSAEHKDQRPHIICCKRKHKSRRCLVDHIKSHLNPNYFKCKYCARVLKERRNFLQHLAAHGASEFCCTVCDKKFVRKFDFKRHTATHSIKELSCKQSGKSFECKDHQTHSQRGDACTPHNIPEKKHAVNKSEYPESFAIKFELENKCDAITNEDSSERHMDEGINYPDALNSQYENENTTENEDMEQYLPSHGIKPGEYDDFLAKHIKFACSVCQESCENFTQLKQHFVDVHDRGGYVLCCGTKHRTRSNLVDHIHTHLNPEYFNCQECSKVFKERRGLILHMAWHKGKIYKCQVCRRTFLDKIKYRAHKSTHKTNERQQFPCPECGKEFGNKSLLSHHQRALHLNMFVKLCDICGITFRGSLCFRNHMEKHKGVAPHTVACDICGRILSGKQTLKQHKMSVHPEGGIRAYTCHICSKSEATQSRLNMHIRKTHATSYDYVCKVCGSAFKQLKSLKAHMVFHTGEPLFTCTWCPKTFNSSGNLCSHRQRAHPIEYQEWKKQRFLGDTPNNLKSKTDAGTLN